MDAVTPDKRLALTLLRWGRSAAAVVLTVTTLAWVGWATGIQELTRIYPSWPQMTPWTALWLAALSASVLVQSGDPSHTRVRVGRGLALAVGVVASVVLAEYATGRAFGMDQTWFGDAVRTLQSTWPGRPSPQTAISVLMLSLAVGLSTLERRWAGPVRTLSWIAAMAAPGITCLAYVFHAVSVLKVAGSTGMALGTALSVLLLGVAAALVRPQRGVLGWLVARPDRQSLLRLAAIIAGFPLLVGLSRLAFRRIGMDDDAALAFSTAVGTGVVGLITLRMSQAEQRQRATADADRALLRASADSMLDPQVLLEAVHDSDGRVVDFRHLSVNKATCDYLGLAESDLVGHSQMEAFPNLKGSELQRRFIQCLENGQPVILDDFTFFNEVLDGARRYDIRATRVGPELLSLTWSDVTDRFLAARRIAESEQNYRLLAENAGDVIVHVRDGRIVWVSPSVEAALGAPPAYWVGREFQEAIPTEAAADLAAQSATVLAGEAVRQRIRVIGADGVTHWFHMYAKPFHDADGHEDGGLATLRLIDDEVATEQAVEESRILQVRAETRYRRSMDTAAIGMCLTTPDGAFLEVNPAMCEMFGYDEESLMHKTWQELTAPGSLGLADDERRALFLGLRDSYRVVGQLIHADGHRIWADVAVSCIRDQNGQVENLAGQISDITAEVQAREQLALSDERNRLLAERLGQQSRRLADELASAANYMASIMPKGLTGAVDVESRYLPSRELGGDSFDYTWIDDDHLLVYLIDVSGHGLEPALLSASVHNMIRSGSLGADTLLAPEFLLAELNALFQMEQQGDHYFTMWCGVYQASTRTLRYANAGSPPPFAFSSADGRTVSVTELSGASRPIGMFEDSEFPAHTYLVSPGCQILVYSDGASEITLADDHQLKPTDFNILMARVASSPDWSLDGLIDELNALSPSAAFEDDLSLIRLDFD